MSTSIQQKALNEAMTRLNAIKAQFHIVMPDGTEYGAPIAPQKPLRTRIIDPAKPKNGPYVRKFLEVMGVGDVAIIPPQTGDDPVRLQGNVTATAGAMWGPGSYMTSVKDGSVEILRLS